jgi:hypothetical protein
VAGCEFRALLRRHKLDLKSPAQQVRLEVAISPKDVAQIGNLLCRRLATCGAIKRSADYQSAIQQTNCLRYGCGARAGAVHPGQALLHFQSSGDLHNRAFTGFI